MNFSAGVISFIPPCSLSWLYELTNDSYFSAPSFSSFNSSTCRNSDMTILLYAFLLYPVHGGPVINYTPSVRVLFVGDWSTAGNQTRSFSTESVRI